MKANKLLVLGLSAMTVLSLASCSGDLDARKQAVAKVANQGIATVGGVDMIAGTNTLLNANSYEAISLAKQSQARVDGVTYTVDIQWTIADEYMPVVKKFADDINDPTHLYLSFNYSQEKQQAFAFSATLTCGEGASAVVEYSATLDILSLIYDDMTFDEFYSVSTETNMYTWLSSDGYIKKNHDQKYYYITVWGKLMYVSADYNFALLANGDKVIQLYRLDELTDKTSIIVGKYIKISGEIASYYGYPQISYCANPEEVEADDEHIEEPTAAVVNGITVTGKNLAGDTKADPGVVEVDGNTAWNQFCAMQHRRVTLSGTVRSNPSSSDGKNRFTFTITATDGSVVEIQHNYHVDSKSGTIGQPIWDAVNGNIGHAITISGVLNYSQEQQKAPQSFVPGNEGSYTIVPLAAADVVVS